MENLKANPEHDNTNNSSGEWSHLAEIPFAGLQEAEKQQEERKAEGVADLLEQSATLPAELPKKPDIPKPVEELSEKDAASEYLELIEKLSLTFTNEEAKKSRIINLSGNVRGGNGPKALNFVDSLLETSLTSEEYEKLQRDDGELGLNVNLRDLQNEAPTSTNQYLNRANSLKLVDDILEASQKWNEGGEQYGKARAALEAYDEEDSQKSTFVKFFTARKRKRERLKLANEVSTAEFRIRKANEALQENLSRAYDDDYRYGHRREKADASLAEKTARNEKYNQLFFSSDNNIDLNRVFELRKKINNSKDRKPE